MKKILAVALVLCLVLALAPMAFADNPVVKIGVFEPQSGDNGAGGKQEVLGMQYANMLTPTVEIDGVEYDVQLVYADNASSNDKAPTAAQDLISNGVSLVLGSYGSGVSIAASDTFANAGVPAIGVTCTNPQVTADCDVYFRICFLDPFQGTVLANFAKSELGASKAYCLAKLGDDTPAVSATSLLMLSARTTAYMSSSRKAPLTSPPILPMPRTRAATSSSHR